MLSQWWGGGGVGWGWWHSCTCTHVRCSATDGLGGDGDVLCTCTHVRCYASDGVVGGGVGMMTFMHLHTCEMLRNWWAGWGWWRSLHMHTCEMLRQWWGGGGWGGDDDIHALGKHRPSKLARLEKNASFALWKKHSFCRATRNYMQFCNRMCLLVTGTWRRRDLLVYKRVNWRVYFNLWSWTKKIPLKNTHRSLKHLVLKWQNICFFFGWGFWKNIIHVDVIWW